MPSVRTTRKYKTQLKLQHELDNAVFDADLAKVQAALKAGADTKDDSQSFWIALEQAWEALDSQDAPTIKACTEIVRELMKAGADYTDLPARELGTLVSLGLINRDQVKLTAKKVLSQEARTTSSKFSAAVNKADWKTARELIAAVSGKFVRYSLQGAVISYASCGTSAPQVELVLRHLKTEQVELDASLRNLVFTYTEGYIEATFTRALMTKETKRMSKSDFKECAKLLLDAGADLGAVSEIQLSALVSAGAITRARVTSTAKKMLSQEALKPETERYFRLAKQLINSARVGDIEAMKAVIASGVNVNYGKGWAVQTAAQAGRVDMMQLLLQAGANSRLDNDLALSKAAIKPSVPAARLLLSLGADVNSLHPVKLQRLLDAGLTRQDIAGAAKRALTSLVKDVPEPLR